jgi:hypothetical protein
MCDPAVWARESPVMFIVDSLLLTSEALSCAIRLCGSCIASDVFNMYVPRHPWVPLGLYSLSWGGRWLDRSFTIWLLGSRRVLLV